MPDLLGRESGMLMMGLRQGCLAIVEWFVSCVAGGSCRSGVAKDACDDVV